MSVRDAVRLFPELDKLKPIKIGNARGSWQEQEALISLRREALELLS